MISLKHVCNFFSPTTAPNRIPNADHHCLVASSATNIHPLIHFLCWKQFIEAPTAVGRGAPKPAGQHNRTISHSTIKHRSLFPKSYSTWYVWCQPCLLAGFLALESDSPYFCEVCSVQPQFSTKVHLLVHKCWVCMFPLDLNYWCLLAIAPWQLSLSLQILRDCVCIISFAAATGFVPSVCFITSKKCRQIPKCS